MIAAFWLLICAGLACGFLSDELDSKWLFAISMAFFTVAFVLALACFTIAAVSAFGF